MSNLHVVPFALASLILLAYAASLWWLLRREHVWSLLWLTVLTSVCLSLRLVYIGDYPPGMNEDEVKILWCTIPMLRQGRLFEQDCTGLPALLSVLFEAQLSELIGPTRWAIRSYSLLGSVLSVPAAFAAARGLGLRVAPSLVAAGLIAVLPWSIFYGRVHQSGEMVLHEMLVVAALARFLRGRGGLPEIGIGALGLCLLFYGYFSGRALLGLTLAGAVLARGRFRLFCLAIPMVAFLGWFPFVYLSNSPHLWVGLSSSQTQAEYVENPIETLRLKTVQALNALTAPEAYDQWLTMRTAAMHPVVVVGLALLGSFTGVRRGLFLWAGFLGGLAPAILGYSPLPSTRRMLMAFPFLSLAAGCALDLVPWARLRQALSAAVVVVAGVQSVRFFFSTDFFLPYSVWIFDAQKTAVVEALPMPPHPRLIITSQLGYFWAPRSHYDRKVETLSAENFFPPNDEELIYAFDQTFAPLQVLYNDVFGNERVQSLGDAFVVRLEARDWSWLRRSGWLYTRECPGDETRSTGIPALYQRDQPFPNGQCSSTGPALHTWRARWIGPPAKLKMTFSGTLEVDTSGGTSLRREGWEDTQEFDVTTGEKVTIRLTTPYGFQMLATLVELTPGGERVPALDWLVPG